MNLLDQEIRLSRVPLQLHMVAGLPYRFPASLCRPDAGLLPLAGVAELALGLCEAAAMHGRCLRGSTAAGVVARFNKALADLADALDAPETTPDQRKEWHRCIGSGEAARDLFLQFTERLPE